jgi:hypothetical protein
MEYRVTWIIDLDASLPCGLTAPRLTDGPDTRLQRRG